jgi:mannonate dehydratase
VQLTVMHDAEPSERWRIATQIGADHAVVRPPVDVSQWEYNPLLHLRQRFVDAGIELVGIEGVLPLRRIQLGLPGSDADVESICGLIRTMGAVGIPMLCYNWMAQFGWLRTSVTTPGRGGAFVTSYDHDLMRHAPPTEAGEVGEDLLWSTLASFLERVVPVAAEARVRLALHPDDPPVSPIRGVSRILTSVEAMERAIDLVPSAWSGIAFCQGTLAAAGADIPGAIRHFGRRGKLFFVHFRDVRGTGERFVETFHDEGQTDMYTAMMAYREVGFSGPIRPDHVPAMAGDDNSRPGYGMPGRIFAIGYMKGLIEGVNHHGR